MEIKEYPNRLILSFESDKGWSIPDYEKEEIAKFGKFLADHGIQYTEGKTERLYLASGPGGHLHRHVLHLILDDVNYTAYKLIKD